MEENNLSDTTLKEETQDIREYMQFDRFEYIIATPIDPTIAEICINMDESAVI